MHALPCSFVLAAAAGVVMPFASAPIPDALLKNAIERNLHEDPPLRPESIRVAVLNGDVTLAGGVTTLAAKWRAARLAESFKGAMSLTNELRVNVPARSDLQVAADVNAAIRHDPATREANVIASSDGDSVTIRGAADSSVQRQLLAEVAARVRGVQGVNLAVSIASPSPRGDAEIAADATDELRDDARLDGRRVDIEVRGRGASLSGVVGSLDQRDAAVEDAWVEGVTNVDSRALRVDWRENERRRAWSSLPLPSESQVATAIRRALSHDTRLGAALPDVTVAGDTATLSGSVPDLRAKRVAEGDARRVRGVWRVVDALAVVPVWLESDARVEKHGPRSVVTTTGATVATHAGVGSAHERKATETDAGVVPVLAVVEDEDELRGPGFGPSATADLRSRVLDDLFWDARVGSGRVAASVATDGDVTLTGTVDSWGEARAARDDALRAGAAQVINLVHVAHSSATAGAPRVPVRVAFESNLPGTYRLERVRMFVDGAVAYDRPSQGSVSIPSGDHAIKVIADYRLHDPVLSYVSGYHVELESTGTIVAMPTPEAFVVTAAAVGGMSTPMAKKAVLVWRATEVL